MRSTFANRAVEWASSAYVTVVTRSSRPTQRRATAEPWSDAACRSTGSWAMFSPRPPGRPWSLVRAPDQENSSQALA
ncbi:hypothetical protein PH203_46390 [Streptomyces sp. S.PB5]|nr:hypothetical protein [Streptomyces sp. S.PB5]MDN3029180.1 hypothetical protein [Streptomyces sp. S.PB5]